MATQKKIIGKLPVFRGEYNKDVVYYKHNIVTYLGSSFISTKDENMSVPCTVGDKEFILSSGWAFFSDSSDAYFMDERFDEMAEVVVTTDDEGEVSNVEPDVVNEAIRKTPQILSKAEQAQARANISAASLEENAVFKKEVTESNEAFKTEIDAKVSDIGSKVKRLNQDNIVVESIGNEINLMDSLILANAFIGGDGTIKAFSSALYSIYGKSFNVPTALKISRNKLPASGAGVIAIVESLNDVFVGNKINVIVDDGTSAQLDEIVFLQPNQYIIIGEQNYKSTYFTEVVTHKINEFANQINEKIQKTEQSVSEIESEIKNDSIYRYKDGEFFEISDKAVESAFINGDGVIAEFGNDTYNIWVHKITQDSYVRVKRNLPSSEGSNRIYVINDLSELYIGATLKYKIDDGETQPIDIVFHVKNGQYIVWGGQTIEKGNAKFNYVTEVTIKEMIAQIDKVWIGKKWAAIGDSITEVNARSNKRYVEYIEDVTGIEGVNLGISGTGYCRDEKFFDRLAKVPNDCDVITFFGGGNDKGELPIGDVADSGTDTFCGWVNNTFDRCIELYPLIPFGVIVPFPWRGCMPYDTNGNGKAFRQVCEALISICERRSIPCLDLYHSSGLFPNNADFLKVAYSKDTIAKKTLSPSDTSVLITAENIEYYQSKSDDTLSIGDYVDLGGGVHPDENGHKLIAPKIKSFLETLIM